MQSFTLKPRYRIEKETKVWDSLAGKWTTHQHAKPKFTENQQQKLSEPQQNFLIQYAALLSENIKLNTELVTAMKAREQAGPLDCVYFHYKLLEQDGFSAIEENPPIRQLTKYLWNLVDRYDSKELSWEAFEDQVERWYLLMTDKLDAFKGPKKNPDAV